MTARLFHSVFACLLLVFTGGCGKHSRCGKTTGPQQVFVRDLQAFEKLNVYDKIQIQLKRSTVNRATLTCGQNLADYIITETAGNELTIRNDNNCNFLRSYKKPVTILLEYTDLWRINFVGAGELSSADTLVQPYLEIDGEGCSGDINLVLKTDSVRFILHTGNTNVNVSGKTGKAYWYSGGTTILDARNIQTGYCFANNSGSGNFYVNAAYYLFAEIDQQGSVFYSGSPLTIDRAGTGTGQLQRL